MIANVGEFDLGIKNNAGTVLGWLRPRTAGTAALADNATSAGIWSIDNLLKTGITLQYLRATTPSGTDSFRLYNAITLDVNRTCFLFGWGNIYALVYDSSTQAFGTLTLVRTGGASNSPLGIMSATNQVLIASFSGTAMEAVTLTIVGTAITVNAAVAAALAETYSQGGSLIAVGTSFVVGFSTTLPNSQVRAISLAGTVSTIGSPAVLSVDNEIPSLYASGSVVRTITANALTLVAKAFSVSGVTLTAGNAPSVVTTTATYRVFQNGNGNLVVNYINNTQFGAIIKLTGTTEAISSIGLNSSAQFTSAVDYLPISASKTVFFTHDGGTNWIANILTDTAGTATSGTAITGATGGALVAPSAAGVVGNIARFLIQNNTRLFQFTLDCAGASAVLSSAIFHSNAPSSGFIGSPQTSQSNGAKAASTLRNGGLYHSIGGNSVFDLLISPGAIVRGSRLGNFSSPTFSAGVDSVSYCHAGADGGAVGAIIQRIEAAA